MFYELTHAAHYNKVGNAWWNDFVDAELNNIIWHPGQNPPYGLGNQGATSAIISVGESWAYHIGHFMADWKYGVNSGCTWEQENAAGFAIQFCSNPPFWTAHPQIDVLEQYDPNLPSDLDAWIPKGLYLDLIDATNENLPVFDRVTGYTNQQFFSALESDIRSVPAFRQRLLQQNNNQVTEVTQLFNSYHY